MYADDSGHNGYVARAGYRLEKGLERNALVLEPRQTMNSPHPSEPALQERPIA